MKRIKLVINNEAKKKEKEKFFIKKELQCILNLYAKMVSNGSWKDYSFSSGVREVSFDVYQRSSEKPVLRITKNFKPYYFNEKFKCAADYNQYLEMLEDNQNFIDKRKYKIVNISNDGFISKRRSESYQDCIKINSEKGRIIGIIYWKMKSLIFLFQ
mgnify:CR=1 FL=1